MKVNFTKVIYGFIVMALYLMIGAFALTKYWILSDQKNTGMIIFGLVVILYGLYRGYRSYAAAQIAKNEKDGDE
jgi:hypothetical protein